MPAVAVAEYSYYLGQQQAYWAGRGNDNRDKALSVGILVRARRIFKYVRAL